MKSLFPMVKIKGKIAPDEFKRGEIWIADLKPVKGHEQDKRRPVLIIQNDIANENSSCVTIIPITTYEGGKVYPTEVLIEKPEGGLEKDSLALASQIGTLDKEKRFGKYMGKVASDTMEKIEEAIKIHLALIDI